MDRIELVMDYFNKYVKENNIKKGTEKYNSLLNILNDEINQYFLTDYEKRIFGYSEFIPSENVPDYYYNV